MKPGKAEIDEIIRKILTKEARERLGRLKLVKPEIVEQLKIYLVQLYKAGKIKEIIDDEKLKEILKKIS
jgi:programmed cell death protein 5